jgi:1,4-alpha-glucan branching enzyme
VDGTYEEIFNSEDARYGGSGIGNGNSIPAQPKPMHGCEQSIELTLPPLSVIYLKCKRYKKVKNLKAEIKLKVPKNKTMDKPAKPKTKRTTDINK